MQVVLAVDVEIPRYVLDIKVRFVQPADKASTLHFLFLRFNKVPLFSESIYDYSKEDVEQDDVYNQEEGEVEYVPRPKSLSTSSGLRKCLSKTTSSPEPET